MSGTGPTQAPRPTPGDPAAPRPAAARGAAEDGAPPPPGTVPAAAETGPFPVVEPLRRATPAAPGTPIGPGLPAIVAAAGWRAVQPPVAAHTVARLLSPPPGPPSNPTGVPLVPPASAVAPTGPLPVLPTDDVEAPPESFTGTAGALDHGALDHGTVDHAAVDHATVDHDDYDDYDDDVDYDDQPEDDHPGPAGVTAAAAVTAAAPTPPADSPIREVGEIVWTATPQRYPGRPRDVAPVPTQRAAEQPSRPLLEGEIRGGSRPVNFWSDDPQNAVERTVEYARTPPKPVDPNAPPERVRVVLAERRGAASPVRTVAEVQAGTAVGSVLRRNLIKSQLGVAATFAVVAVLVLGLLPLVFAYLPEVSKVDVWGIRLPWLVLGLLVYPFLLLLGWLHTRNAERVEQSFADYVQE